MKSIKFLAAGLFALAVSHVAQADPGDSIEKGRYLARAGNCVACHSTPNGKAFAGGLKMGTPLGAIYTTNITPDPETGIGQYTIEDFDRALRQGIAKDGHRLYPAMPYPSYAKLTDADIRALYDYFLKAVDPVKQANMASEIRWPLNMRWPLALWDVVFVDSARYSDKPDADASWNRGAYLVQGLGHCGACHTPRGVAWNEKALTDKSPRYLAGAMLDDWSAPDLKGDLATGLGGWSHDDLVAYLKTGHNAHGTAFGSMIDVVNNSTQYLTDSDLNAMADYLKSLSPSRQEQVPVAADEKAVAALKSGHLEQPGAVTYARRCEACHLSDGKGHPPYLPPLIGNPVVPDGNASSLINVVLNGSSRVVVAGQPDAYWMPAFRALLSDAEIADVVNFMRNSWGGHAPPVTADKVNSVRNETDPASDRVVILKMR